MRGVTGSQGVACRDAFLIIPSLGACKFRRVMMVRQGRGECCSLERFQVIACPTYAASRMGLPFTTRSSYEKNTATKQWQTYEGFQHNRRVVQGAESHAHLNGK